MSLRLNFNRAYALLYVFCILASGFFLTCSNDSDDDILTATYEFTNACDDRASAKTCTNYYPDDEAPFPCGSARKLSDKCPASGVIGVCSKLPKTLEKVYYTGYAGGVTGAMTDCTSIGQTQFSSSYDPR